MTTDAYTALIEQLEKQSVPPVETWQPRKTDRIDIHIDEFGDWYHEGRKIRRKGLVKIFSHVMRLEDESYFLVTPEEKMEISVAFLPFIAVDFEVANSGFDQSLVFKTNTDDVVPLDGHHPIEMTPYKTERRPVLTVRSNLRALIARSTFARLTEYMVFEESQAILRSHGEAFVLDYPDE